jgi:hypothetical protein
MEHGTLARYTHGGCRCPACRAAMTDYKREHRGAQRVGTDMPKDTGEPDVQAEPELSALDDLPLLKPFGQLPDGRLVLADAAGALYVAGFATSPLEDDSDEACPTCGLIHEVLDDEAPGDGGQGHERPEPETDAAERKPTGTAEPADATLHAHQHGPDDAPRYHAHAGGDQPHAHKLPRTVTTTTGYRLPKAPATPKTGAKVPPTPKVGGKVPATPKQPAQATSVRTSPAKQPTKGGRRRVIVTSAWHAHRAASERERKDET